MHKAHQSSSPSPSKASAADRGPEYRVVERPAQAAAPAAEASPEAIQQVPSSPLHRKVSWWAMAAAIALVPCLVYSALDALTQQPTGVIAQLDSVPPSQLKLKDVKTLRPRRLPRAEAAATAADISMVDQAAQPLAQD